MKLSNFNVAQPYNGNVLVYNTFTTSLVEIPTLTYTEIFEKQNFSAYSDDALSLYSAGFLIDDNCNELAEQESFRKTVMNLNSGKISNIIIAPTLDCNARCFYCFEKGHRTGTMTKKTADALVKHLKKTWNGELLGITWFGGEPLLAFNTINYIIDGLKTNGIRFTSKITTNGSLLIPKYLEIICKDWNVDSIQITIDAIGKEYEKIKNYINISNAFDIVVNNIRTALSFGLKVKVRVNFNPLFPDTALQVMQYFNDNFSSYSGLKVYFAPIDENETVVKNITDSFGILPEHPFISLINYGRSNELYYGFPDMEDLEKTERYDSLGFLEKLKLYPSPTNCYATCPNVYSIDHDGDIYKCHRTLGRKEYVTGNVFTGITENNAYNFFCNTELTYPECEQCSLLPICQGGCKINPKLFSGQTACIPTKAIIKDLILLYKKDIEKYHNEKN